MRSFLIALLLTGCSSLTPSQPARTVQPPALRRGEAMEAWVFLVPAGAHLVLAGMTGSRTLCEAVRTKARDSAGTGYVAPQTPCTRIWVMPAD